ncbi:B3 domain-containing protein REM16-like [Forsythia ovata]|uniref:B3 domain-containing protein REM16-like n=1 Tax=Forsythia ovata TaxID=205694 RepID=A0ABD1UWB6_9LAMI
MYGPFDQQVVIPKSLANNVREKLAGTVALKGPSGNIWDVGLITNWDKFVLKQDWKAFTEDHFPKDNDTLTCKQTGNSRYDVLLYGKIIFCEKEASYCVKKCQNTFQLPVTTNYLLIDVWKDYLLRRTFARRLAKEFPKWQLFFQSSPVIYEADFFDCVADSRCEAIK